MGILLMADRTAKLKRDTLETQISVEVNLDGETNEAEPVEFSKPFNLHANPQLAIIRRCLSCGGKRNQHCHEEARRCRQGKASRAAKKGT